MMDKKECCGVNLEFSDMQPYCVYYYEDYYMKMFLDNIDLPALRYACVL